MNVNTDLTLIMGRGRAPPARGCGMSDTQLTFAHLREPNFFAREDDFRQIVIATRHPRRRDRADMPNSVPKLHLVANDLGEYMQFRAAVILGIRVLSISMECGWDPNCFMRKSDVAALRRRGIEIPPAVGWVHCEFQEGSEPPPLWFFHGRYGAIKVGERFRYLCRRDWTEPEAIGLLPRDEFPPEKFDWSKGVPDHG